MSIANTLSILATKLLTVDPSPQPPPARVYADPAEAVSLGDFPCIILAAAPQVQHQMNFAASQNMVESYKVAMYAMLGTLQSNLPELHSRVLPWPRAIARALVADLKLGGAVQFVGDGNGGLFTWEFGPLPWADDVYFGIKLVLPVTEWFTTPTG